MNMLRKVCTIRSMSFSTTSSKGVFDRRVCVKAAESLKLYSKVFNTTLIPQCFQVPVGDTNWPEKFWGDKAGMRLTAIRVLYNKNLLSNSDIKMLEQSGIKWEVSKNSPKYFKELAQGIIEYYKNNDSTNGRPCIPYHFTIPKEGGGEWTNSLRGMKLGKRVASARHKYHSKRLRTKDIEALEAAGIDWNIITADKIRSVIRAMTIYKKLHRTTNIPANYVIDDDASQWPVEFHGENIGRWLQRVRVAFHNNRLDSEKIAMLEDAGIAWVDPAMKYRSTWVERLLAGISIYKNLFDTTLIPKDFVVPDDDTYWPVELHGDKLGVRLYTARQCYDREELTQEEVDLLEGAGIQWMDEPIGDVNPWILKLRDGIRTYKEIYGTTSIPQDFSVPRGDCAKWAEALHGDKTGHRLMRARQAYRKKLLNKHEISLLEDVGITWVDASHVYRHVWVDRLAKGMRIYEKLYGTTSFSLAFVVPVGSSDWPEDLHGDKLGLWLKSARKRKKDMIPEYVKTLEDAGIKWRAFDNKEK